MSYEGKEHQQNEADRIIGKVHKKARQKAAEVKAHVAKQIDGLRDEAAKDAEHTKQHFASIVKKESISNKIALGIVGVLLLVVLYNVVT